MTFYIAATGPTLIEVKEPICAKDKVNDGDQHYRLLFHQSAHDDMVSAIRLLISGDPNAPTGEARLSSRLNATPKQ